MRQICRLLCPLAVTGTILAFASLQSVSCSSPVAPGLVQKVLAEDRAQSTAQPEMNGTSASAGSQRQTERASLPEATDEERRFVELTNRERLRRGMSELRIDPLLIAVAREHSAEMRDRDYFSHHSPSASLRTPMDRYLHAVAAARPPYACVGENLFYCTISDVERGHRAFMNSPKHRENVLYPRFEKIGVGIVKDREGKFWVTQMFLTTTDAQSVAKKMSSAR